MKSMLSLFVAAVVASLVTLEARADCQLADAKLEETILQNPRLRGKSNRQSVRDLRSLRDAAFTLRSYGRHEDCERLLANIRELAAGPAMTTLGDNDEAEAEKQDKAREPKAQRGAPLGRRDEKGAEPLLTLEELEPGLRADEILGAEVRSSDDKIIGEVRNIVLATKDRPDYAIVASGGFFTTGKDSIVVPMRLMKVSRERDSFFLPIRQLEVKTIPVMPDQNFEWLSDKAWLRRNNAFFGKQ